MTNHSKTEKKIALSLLDIKLEEVSIEEARAMRAAGIKITPVTLYAPEHAPKGTRFIRVQGRPYRLTQSQEGNVK